MSKPIIPYLKTPLALMTDADREKLLRDFYARERIEEAERAERRCAEIRRDFLVDFVAPFLASLGVLLLCIGVGAFLAVNLLSCAGWAPL